MRVLIRIETKNRRGETTVDTKEVTTLSQKRLTAHAATRVLHREFPDLPSITTAHKNKFLPKGVFSAWTSLKGEGDETLWRNFYLTEVAESAIPSPRSEEEPSH